MAKKKQKPLKICFVASEVVPFAKTGGLADVSGALGKYLSNLGHDIRLVMPFYSAIDMTRYDFEPLAFAQNLEIWFGSQKIVYSIYMADLPDAKAKVYFVHCPHYYSRWNLYTNDIDEHLRFALLSRATLELCQRMQWAPDIFHCNDWQTGLLPIYLKTIYSWDRLFENSKSVMTIHNIGYQGIFPGSVINELNLGQYYTWFDANDLYSDKINFLRTGIIHSEKITTVSETYAMEIQTDFYGEGLQNTLATRSEDLIGILNGVDYDEWSPETDKIIPYRYSSKNLSGKRKNKEILLSQFNLEFDPDIPLIGIITRLAHQKGIELLRGTMEKVLTENKVQFIVLGSGESEYEQYLYWLQQVFPDKVVFYKGYNHELSHLIEAGADIFLMPSKYEPCGLNQIYSLKYGTVPIIRKTGGLADTVEFYDWEKQKGTGFVFDYYNSDSLHWAIQHAINSFEYKPGWKKLMIRGMQQDFSWDKQIGKYLDLYYSVKTN